jgi:hypothetical protein
MTDHIDTAPAQLKRVEGADDASLAGRWRYANAIASAGNLVPAGLHEVPTDDHGRVLLNRDGSPVAPRPAPGKIMVVTEVARMLGFHPLAGLMGVNIIDGRPTISPALMSAKVREAGHRLRVGVTGTIGNLDLVGWATLTRDDDPDYEYRVEWSLADAEQAGLGQIIDGKWTSEKEGWRMYPRSMLKARAIAEVCREAAEDCLMGAAYIPDELGAATNEQGEYQSAPQKPTSSQDWEGRIAALASLDEAYVLREELRHHADYTAPLWGQLMARVGMLTTQVVEPEPEEEPAAGTEEPAVEAEVDDVEPIEAEVVHQDSTPKPRPPFNPAALGGRRA